MQMTTVAHARVKESLGAYAARCAGGAAPVSLVVALSKELHAERKRVGDLVTALAAMQLRLAVLEQRPALRYCGTWRQSGHYSEGALITRAGGLWLAERETDRTPGTESSGWKLIVKEGAAR
jgi:hypothetical protein